jgi:hypothetical protein
LIGALSYPVRHWSFNRCLRGWRSSRKRDPTCRAFLAIAAYWRQIVKDGRMRGGAWGGRPVFTLDVVDR